MLCLAPKMQIVIASAIAACEALGLDPIVYETCRSQELQQWYFDHGASHASDALRAWHIYGLAVDVISKSREWKVWPEWNVSLGTYLGGDELWWKPVCRIFKAHGLSWGGDWVHFKDTPHWQWGRCKPSPSDQAVLLYGAGGKQAVWSAVGAAA